MDASFRTIQADKLRHLSGYVEGTLYVVLICARWKGSEGHRDREICRDRMRKTWRGIWR